MDWDVELITLYLFVCKHYEAELSNCCARMTRYAKKHLKGWFPHLPGYKAFDHRINQLHDIFGPFVHLLCGALLISHHTAQLTGLTESMPITMAQRGRRFHAKVASEIATKNGYCATKKLHYYGVKLHAVATRKKGSLTIPTCLRTSFS